MKNRIILLTGALLGASLITACGGASNTTVNVNKPAANAANATANSTSNTNSAASTSNTAANTAAVPASGAAQDFTLVNKTGVVIDKLYVSPANKDEWGEDILGKDQMADGDSWEIKFHPKEKSEDWDLRVEDTSGNSIEWNDLKLTEINKVTLHYKDGKGTAEVE